MNAISFSLFGLRPLYTEGLLQNIHRAPAIYPGWEVVVHIEQDHPSIPEIQATGARIITHPAAPGLIGTHWRFQTLFEAERYHRVIVRDADSRLNRREQAAVQHWIEQGTLLHTMWDKPGRRRRRNISAGMFGMLTSALTSEDFRQYQEWPRVPKLGNDETYLNKQLWPRFRHSLTAHRRSPRQAWEIPFPPQAPMLRRHIGQRVWPPPRPRLPFPVFRMARAGGGHPGEILLSPVFGGGKVVGTAAAHLHAAQEILASGTFPCLLLEEDATWIDAAAKHPPPPLPPWLWVGLSKWHIPESGGAVRRIPSAPGPVFSLGGMCGIHGILYGTPEGPARMIQCARHALRHNIPIDVAVIRISRRMQWDRPGYTRPWVYQAGRNRLATRFHIGP
jgi:hypothetical protein